MSEFMKSIGTCLWHVPMGRYRWLPKGTCPPTLAIDIQSLSGIRSLVWPAALTTTFLQGLARWHVARATWHQSLRDWHHRLSAVPARRMVPRRSRSAQPFVLQVPKCLNGHTDGQTDKHHWPNFFSATHQRKSSSIKAPMLTHWSLYTLRF